MRRLVICFLLLGILLPGCGSVSVKMQPYSVSFLGLFDTVVTVVGRDVSEAALQTKAEAVRVDLERYHQLFDIYHSYDGIANLKTVNEQAGISPVKVDKDIIALLKDCKAYYTLTDGKVNVAMGGVLQLWHECRSYGITNPEFAMLPSAEKLKGASAYSDINAVVIDEAASTVYITDSRVQLDVGAVAKGWAAQRVAEKSPDGLLISVGGNVCVTGPKDTKGTPWVVGIQKPDGDGNVHTLNITNGCVVTSGDYQRMYMVDGKAYHHIIDPETLMPSTYWRSVTVVCDDSALADVLSTALFLLPLDAGKNLAEKCGAEVMWLNAEGDSAYTSRFQALIRE